MDLILVIIKLINIVRHFKIMKTKLQLIAIALFAASSTNA